MLSYMIPSEEASGKQPQQQATSNGGSPQPAAVSASQPLVHKARARQQHHGNGVLVVHGDHQVPGVNGQQHSSTTTVMVNADGGGTTTTTTFSSTSNVNGNLHTTKKIIKTYREPLTAAQIGGSSVLVSSGVAAGGGAGVPVGGPSPYGGGMSTESSASSLSTAASDAAGQAATPTSATSGGVGDKPKPKLLANGTKNPGLKRVSFGSSKGSMVETLIYESPLQEEPEVVTPSYDLPPGVGPVIDPSIIANDPAGAAGADRVRVTFFESSKPQVVEAPDGADILSPEDLDAPCVGPGGMAGDSAHGYARQNSTDSGWDNPFRPDGDLSREADEIVELIKGGKPITPTPGLGAAGAGATSPGSPIREAAAQQQNSSPVTSTPQRNGANGSAAKAAPGSVDVTRGTVASGGDPAQVEHITIKKKPKCKCCVVQ